MRSKQKEMKVNGVTAFQNVNKYSYSDIDERNKYTNRFAKTKPFGRKLAMLRVCPAFVQRFSRIFSA
jgi:hypothetical protein